MGGTGPDPREALHHKRSRAVGTKRPGERLGFPEAKRSEFDVIDCEGPERSPKGEHFVVSLRRKRRNFGLEEFEKQEASRRGGRNQQVGVDIARQGAMKLLPGSALAKRIFEGAHVGGPHLEQGDKIDHGFFLGFVVVVGVVD